MATLHVLSHSPFTDDRLASCLRVLGPEDGLLLCGDAVYALADASALRHPRLYALEEDVQARAVVAKAAVEVVDYPAFVALTLTYAKVNSWL
ncbi:sulfurtransferase complex subunit TusB [Pseudomonas typographi]|uniref:sulfurtransferase complex subunit TusB n=1 Tax=Pseudomonas typographi TaxID=2715964 RepID=UPI001689217C|nr:sulfurtransferase complex subunit TusB [Pseudomonas typographi]MBD1586350.1 sulfurtransferase complex subunit TusB [Pseudomonas typographi]